MATDVKVILSFYPETAGLQVQDNGVGFDSEGIKSGGRGGGFDLLGMEQRARLLGGDFEVRSRQGGGTLVEVRLPAD